MLGPLVHTFTAKDVEPVSSVLEWHPSEATGMLAATARGVRGTCEVRDAGLPVALTDEGPTVHEVDLDDAVTRNQLARAIMATETLDEVEAHSREICGYSEIDYERNKAAWLKDQPPADLVPQTVLGPTRPVRGRSPPPRSHPHNVPPPHRGPRTSTAPSARTCASSSSAAAPSSTRRPCGASPPTTVSPQHERVQQRPRSECAGRDGQRHRSRRRHQPAERRHQTVDPLDSRDPAVRRQRGPGGPSSSTSSRTGPQDRSEQDATEPPSPAEAIC